VSGYLTLSHLHFKLLILSNSLFILHGNTEEQYYNFVLSQNLYYLGEMVNVMSIHFLFRHVFHSPLHCSVVRRHKNPSGVSPGLPVAEKGVEGGRDVDLTYWPPSMPGTSKQHLKPNESHSSCLSSSPSAPSGF
jgi:hypothetical protein